MIFEFCSLLNLATDTRGHWELSSFFLSPGKKVSLPGNFPGTTAEPMRVIEPRPMALTSLPFLHPGGQSQVGSWKASSPCLTQAQVEVGP